MEAEERLVPSKETQVLRSQASCLGPFVVLTGMGCPAQEQRVHDMRCSSLKQFICENGGRGAGKFESFLCSSVPEPFSRNDK